MQTKPSSVPSVSAEALRAHLQTGGLPVNDEIEAAFPTIDPGVKPLGSRVLVQLRGAKEMSGSLYLPDSAKDAEKWNTQVALVRGCGSLAFHNRNSGEEWPEGAWVAPGDFVRVPKYGGDRFEVPMAGGGKALFALFNDLELLAVVTGDPLKIIAYV